MKKFIEKSIPRIANNIISNPAQLGNFSLIHGKLGIAIFLYSYFKYSGKLIYEEFAEELIDEISNNLNKFTTFNYAEGLSGFEIGISYLINKKFIDANPNEVFEDVDSLLYYCISHPSTNKLDAFYGLTGIGNCMAYRLMNSLEKSSSEPFGIMKDCLKRLINMLNTPINSFDEVLSAIKFLSLAHRLLPEEPKTKAYLDYAIDKLETMVYEDIHFKMYPYSFVPIDVALILMQTSEYTLDMSYIERGINFLHLGQNDSHEIHINKGNPIFNLFKWSLIYKYLGIKLNETEFIKMSNYYLDLGNTKCKLTPEFFNYLPIKSIHNGTAGIGLILLTMIEGCSFDWLEIIYLFRQKDILK